MARPTVMTEQVIAALRQAYLVGATNEEAAHYAGIAPATIYSYIEKHPEFSEQISAWKSEPILKAKQTIIKNMHDPKVSQWYLERKAKQEYGRNVDITSDGKVLPTPILQGVEPKEKEDVQADDRPTEALIPEEED